MPAYICIDLKSFYASVECAARGMDPLNTNLVVADTSRSEKTICLAVSPSLKAIGIPGRPRLFEVIQRVELENRRRRNRAPQHKFTGKSCFADELARDPALETDYIAAVPRMHLYMSELVTPQRDYDETVVEEEAAANEATPADAATK